MKAILLSVPAQTAERILSGEQTILLSKRKPNCDLPIDVYLFAKNGEIGTGIFMYGVELKGEYLKGGKVVSKFTLREVENIFHKYNNKPQEFRQLQKNACLTESELFYCAGNDDLFAWHISDLQVFDKAMELGEFYTYNKELEKRFLDKDGYCCYDGKNECGELMTECSGENLSQCYSCWEEWSGWCHRVTRPPQSWQYVEVLEEQKL